MCAIVDANVANDVFGPDQSPAGEKFYDWINKEPGRLVVGGELLGELERGSSTFRRELVLTLGTLAKTGRMRIVNAGEVNAKVKEI